MITQQAIDEIRALEEQGKLAPSYVLERARDPGSALHEHFDWDDAEAAHRYRLEQADRLITKVRVRIIERSAEESAPRQIRATLQPVTYGRDASAPWLRAQPTTTTTQRAEPPRDAAAQASRRDDPSSPTRLAQSGGPITQTMPKLVHRADDSIVVQLDPVAGGELLMTALAELGALRRRYAHLDQLAPVFEEIDRFAVRVVEPAAEQLARAKRFARGLMENEGLDIHTAAERGASAMHVDRVALLGALRMREAS